ncbi:MAG: glycosyltransferase, partial [Flavobacteriales bacterium]|nr:glycosyltransferase [Flavobacteriales bacterium]
MLVSIIIPCYNNQDELGETLHSIDKVIDQIGGSTYQFEIILIDDASEDHTWEVIQKAKLNTSLRGLKLKQNVGAYTAILAGYEILNGDSVIVMAADGDDPPALIPQLLNHYSGNTNLVQANRKISEKGLIDQFFGKLFVRTLTLVGAKNIPAGGSDFVLFSKALIDKAALHGWKTGNTLIQLFQLTDNVAIINYNKGNAKPSTWSFS